MCGIVGIIDRSENTALDRMTDIQAHRGPDDRGTWESRLPDGRWIGLGSRRLAILDLSPAGNMPMSTPDGRMTIAYNGEIYNYPKLRQGLEDKGYYFRSDSDTEAVLYLYQEYGPECVHYLNGMFAIGIWDQDRQHLFIARDHFGIKPLYYCQQGDRFAFASEIKSLLLLPDMRRCVNFTALHQYLTFLWVPDPLTMFEGIYKLPAGHYAIFKDGMLDIKQYWDLQFPDAKYNFKSDETELANELAERFTASVKAHMHSDVPIGAFLSAGVDSSSIVAVMSAATSQPVRTFTISFPKKYRRGEMTLDDTAVAQRTAQYFGCHHTDILVEPDVADLLPKLVWHMDEPISDPAIITAYLVTREAHKDVTVLLSGVGGDELFAGYRKYQAHFWADRYRHIPQILRKYLIEPAVLSLPAFRDTQFKGYARLLKKMIRSGSLSQQDRFIMDSIYLTDDQKKKLYSSSVPSFVNGIDPRSQHLSYFNQVAHADFLNQMLYLDTKSFMVSLNLTYNDKMSMASSVEVRVPFVDRELAEWVAWNIPPTLKLHRGTTKFIFREAMRSVLPAEVLCQKKAGFYAPIDYWLAYDLHEMVDDLLSESNLKKRGLFNPQVVRHLIDAQRKGREDWSFQIWQFLTLEFWMQTFID